MWVIDNQTPFAVDRNWIRDKRGCHHWVVAVRATFDVSDSGVIAIADKQRAPILAPEYYGKPGASSLRCDSDLLYGKNWTDVVVNGHARPSSGRAVKSALVQLRGPGIDKQLIVYGPRTYRAGVGLDVTEPEPFTVQAITYDWAFGGVDFTHENPAMHGMDERNPIGKGFTRSGARLAGTDAHRIEFPDGRAARAGPAGFGAIEPSWRPRRDRAGTYDQAWEEQKRPLLPDDYDDRFGSCAPDDQRIEQCLKGGEPFELLGMTPSGRWAFDLPMCRFSFESRFGTARRVHEGRLVTVLLDADTQQLSLTYQSRLPVDAHEVDYLDQTTVGLEQEPP